MFFQQITDPRLAQNAYLIGCEQSRTAILIDPERDIERYATIAAENGLIIVAAADTHIHADYLSGLRQCAHEWDVDILVSGEGGEDWRYRWVDDPRYRCVLLKDGDVFHVGNVRLDILHTPGHTPEHLTFLVSDTAAGGTSPTAVVTGDFVFVGDVGRPDLLESAAGFEGTMRESARVLFESIARFRALDPSLKLWPGHGAGSACGKALGGAPYSTVGSELNTNPSIQAAIEQDAFVDFILADQPEPPPYFARMKRENRDGPRILIKRPQPTHIASSKLADYLNQPGVAILDCRAWDDYRVGHLSGALYTPLNTSFTTSVGSYVQPQERVVAVCGAGELSDVITACLHVGVDHVIGWLSPTDLAAYADAGGVLIPTPVTTVAALPTDLAHNGMTLLDVRRSAELRETGHIEGAVNIPHTQLLLRHAELPRDRKIHILCRTGNRSGYASGCLQRLGYDVVYVGGGIVQWLELGRPIIRPLAARSVPSH